MLDDRLKKVKKLGDFAGELGVSLAALSIAWTIANPQVSTTILGATKKTQLTENIKALDVLKLLTPEVMEKIEAIMKTKPKAPDF
jgi:aryl-alcohol dehydrogenase-like predicted oxidoreductase